jgi:hypothetical protein
MLLKFCEVLSSLGLEKRKNENRWKTETARDGKSHKAVASIPSNVETQILSQEVSIPLSQEAWIPNNSAAAAGHPSLARSSPIFQSESPDIHYYRSRGKRNEEQSSGMITTRQKKTFFRRPRD